MTDDEINKLSIMTALQCLNARETIKGLLTSGKDLDEEAAKTLVALIFHVWLYENQGFVNEEVKGLTNDR